MLRYAYTYNKYWCIFSLSFFWTNCSLEVDYLRKPLECQQETSISIFKFPLKAHSHIYIYSKDILILLSKFNLHNYTHGCFISKNSTTCGGWELKKFKYFKWSILGNKENKGNSISIWNHHVSSLSLSLSLSLSDLSTHNTLLPRRGIWTVIILRWKKYVLKKDAEQYRG